MIPDLTLLRKAPVVTLKKYFGELDEQVLRPMTWIMLSLPDFEAIVGRGGVFCSLDSERSCGFSGLFLGNSKTPNLQKLPDG
jgi:hypothetical protein